MGGESASDPSDSGTETEPGPPGEDGAALETENETEEAVKPVADADATVAGEKGKETFAISKITDLSIGCFLSIAFYNCNCKSD